MGTGLPSSAITFILWPGQRDAAVFDGAGVQEMDQQPLAFADADRITGTKRLVVDRVGHRADFEAVGIRVHRRRLFQQRPIVGIVVLVVHGPGEERLPVAQGEKEFLVVLAGIVAAVNVNKAKLAGVGTLVQVIHGHGVGVIPAASRGPRRELKPAPAVRRHQRRALFFGAIHLRRNQHAVPMHQFRRIRIVDHVNGHRLAFAHAQHRPGRGAVVADGRENVGAVQFNGDGTQCAGCNPLYYRVSAA